MTVANRDFIVGLAIPFALIALAETLSRWRKRRRALKQVAEAQARLRRRDEELAAALADFQAKFGTPSRTCECSFCRGLRALPPAGGAP